MSTEPSTPHNEPTTVPMPVSGRPVSDGAPTNSAVKGAATLRRHKEERRAESLRQIREQTADGTLIVRQMTPAQHEAATELARETFARNEARGKRYTAPGKRDK